ncbi:N-acetylmuramic acid 6-phosphate etherase [Listeria sp. FSL L7-1485]|uniref:N-acetylmuramic acid 6-phosphate etherase n=1 Tax=Listeria immobilis TaxID=2713502 RepID=A0A7X1C877_9LIST|nr:N-acetylmuramic acid 6-phosphate etherase [Listeria immobilis]MBC1484536.1 N-acetylmuramic acid 6-phosphate etherase [Listeria immobilis]MBC1487982.1 N-acetylmuramic acid 6-phosphate etherase [Listeria immobilis]MBC1506499.1 N-acetylmuramic acid 6-phosphate etherase [Listeria immobilis]MBC1509216.1 N-acetylmuramic acid 6-phosphate etherase [Listeria immobilis]MBC1516467.1 N-acetylmuramic acid 6-phosphate etherase [Listeria immobilis]
MLENLGTEGRNKKTVDLDTLSPKEILAVMNEEDATVPTAIKKVLPQIERIVSGVINSFEQGGRLIYLGAGTSGRLGVLDAAECVPTFGVAKEQVIGLIAGGEKAFVTAVEGAEDSISLGQADLKEIQLTKHDFVIGIAASGRTPYVIGALDYANSIGAKTGAISCNANAEISAHADIAVEIVTGAEVLTGSTRLKAGTAQKLVLNMISTASMVGIGKVYKNLMVDVLSTNKKLEERSKRIIMEATEVDYETASRFYETSGRHVKVAIVMILTDSSKEVALEKLKAAKGFVRNTIKK